MTRADILRAIEEATLQQPGSVRGDEAFAEVMGWDSLTGAEFRLLVLDRWDFQISGVALTDLRRFAAAFENLGEPSA